MDNQIKINLITSEILHRIRPDTSVLKNNTIKNYLGQTYGAKGECLAVKSPYHEDVYGRYPYPRVINVMNKSTKTQYDYFRSIVFMLTNDETSMPLLTDKFSSSVQLVDSYTRAQVEHNPKFWQLVVCGVVKVKEGFMFLKNTETHPRLPSLVTSIQGHVEPSIEMHLKTSYDFLRDEFIREFLEELYVCHTNHLPIERIKEKTKFIGAVQINTDVVSMEHLGLVFMVDLSHIESHDITSNEPEKHAPFIISTELLNSGKVNFVESDIQVDSWVEYIINDLIRKGE